MKKLILTTTLALLITALTLAWLTTIAPPAQAQSPDLNGTYVGTVVISDPVGLPPLDLASVLTDTSGSVTGYIDSAQTLAYPIVDAGRGQGPTVSGTSGQITSQVFTNTGTTVSRQVVLGNIVATDGGETLTGDYHEMLWGLTPGSLVMTGTFTLIRPDRGIYLPPDGGIYLPIVVKG